MIAKGPVAAEHPWEDWGTAEEKWGNGGTEVGLVIVGGLDFRGITPYQVEAIAFFCRHVINPAIRDLHEWWESARVLKSKGPQATESKQRQGLIKTLMCRSYFEKFFRDSDPIGDQQYATPARA